MTACAHGHWLYDGETLVCRLCGAPCPEDDEPITPDEWDALVDYYRKQGVVPEMPPRPQ